MPTPMLDAALALAARGFRIIPLYDPGPDGKRPRINDWQKHATTDPATIRAWWTKWPNANVGGAMGGPARTIAIDIDGAKGGYESWKTLVDAHFWGDPTLETWSGSGNGGHVFLRLQPHHDLARIRNAIEFRPGLDVRSDGGQVVLPPSLHTSGFQYRWASHADTPPAPLPDWLYDILATDPAHERKPEAHTPRESPPLIERIEGARRAVLALPPAVSGKGGHNAILVAATTAYRGFDLPRGAAEIVLDDYNRELARPPFSPTELAHKLNAVEENERVGEHWGYLLDVDDMSAALAPDVPPERAPAEIAGGIEWISAATMAEPLGAPRWVVKDLQIVPGRPTMLAGYGASGKTLLAQSLCLAFAAGRPIWNAFEPGEGGRVVRHFDHEQGRYATLRRYQRLAHGLGIPLGQTGIDLAVACLPDIRLDQNNAREAYLLACAGANLVVIDALRGAAPGEDENDSQIRRCIDHLGWVSDRIGCAFVLIHHAGKATQTDMRAGPRGSSAIFDGCGSVLNVTADDPDGPKQVHQTKGAAEAEGGLIAPFQLSIEDTEGSGLVVRYRAFEAPQTPAEKFDARTEVVLAFVAGNPGTRGGRVLEDKLGMRHGASRSILDELEDRGAVVNRGTKTRPRLFTREADPGHLVEGDAGGN